MRVDFDWYEAYPVYELREPEPLPSPTAMQIEVPDALYHRYVDAAAEWEAVQEILAGYEAQALAARKPRREVQP